MPLNGNRLGGKTRVEYTSDSTVVYGLKIDTDLIPASTALTPGNGGVATPSRFKPRGVFVQLVEAGKIFRKFLVCNPGAPLYIATGPTDVTIDGATFTSTGRKGEKLSY